MEKEEISCPKCGKHMSIRVYPSVNISENTSIKKQILSGRFNVSKCSNCKSSIKHRSHVLVTKLNPPKWIWLVSKSHQSPQYQNEFLNNVLPQMGNVPIEQQVVFIDFGKSQNGLKFVFGDKLPSSKEDWLEYGKLLSGEKAVDCYYQALHIDKEYKEAKLRLNEELDALKSYP